MSFFLKVLLTQLGWIIFCLIEVDWNNYSRNINVFVFKFIPPKGFKLTFNNISYLKLYSQALQTNLTYF